MATRQHGFVSRLYNELAVRNRSELNQALDIDAAVGAKELWGNASGSAGYFKNVQMTTDSFYWLVHADYKMSGPRNQAA